jgi:hypothetical protein
VLETVCVSGSAVLQQACSDLHRIKGLAEIEICEVHASSSAAIAISSGVTTGRNRKGVLVFNLENNDGRWLINDIDLVSQDKVEEKLIWFSLTHRDSETLVEVANK